MNKEPSTSAITRLMQELGKLPGIGPKTAERLTHHLLGCSRQEVFALAEALQAIKESIRLCTLCHNLTEAELCVICADSRRDPTTICVVEQPRDLMVLERVGTYRGVFHVLHGRLAPLENIGPEHLKIETLLQRARNGKVKEIIMATNPTLEGDGTALYLSSLLAEMGVKVTRLARGLPTGSSIEFANTQMLSDALEGRRTF